MWSKVGCGRAVRQQGVLYLVQRTTAGDMCPAVTLLGPGDVRVPSVNEETALAC